MAIPGVGEAIAFVGSAAAAAGAAAYVWNHPQETGNAIANWSRVLNEAAEAEGGGPQIHEGKQGKHQPGDNNFIPGRSELTDPDPQGLVDQHAGSGQQVGPIPVGQPGSKERVDFGKNIGNYVDPTGEKSPTTNGIIHHGSDGVHIVPSRPNSSQP